MARYPSGLGPEVIERRQRNVKRILDYFGATPGDWQDHHWHLRHLINVTYVLKEQSRAKPSRSRFTRWKTSNPEYSHVRRSVVTPVRRNRLILLVILVLLVGGMFYVARAALFPYILGLVIAYLVLPLVNFLNRIMPASLAKRNLSRPLAIIIVYLVVILIIVGFFIFLVPIVADQMEALWAQREELLAKGQALLNELLSRYRTYIPLNVQEIIQSNLEKLIGLIGQAVQEGAIRTFKVVSSTISYLLGIMVIPFWLFYILHDESQFKKGAFSLIPERYGPDVRNIARIIDDILSAYIRGQLLLCLFIGAMSTVGLLIIGVDFAVLLGIVAGAFEILPFVGPILGAIPAILVAALTHGTKTLWTLLLFIVIQQVENTFLAPRIAGESVKLHPAIIMVVLVIGNEALGIWGMLVAVPVTAIIRDVFKYLYLRFSDEVVTPEEALARIRTEEVKIDI